MKLRKQRAKSARGVRLLVLVVGLWLSSLAQAWSQVPTGSITGIVTDGSGAVLPGVTVALAGERLIGGTHTEVTGADGAYRFDRLPPGLYDLKCELRGFKTIERPGIRVNAGFTAVISVELEVGQVSEAITVSVPSPTVDTKSTVHQTVMSQEILEGVPTGRDPWSLAKLVPGVQVATYDVGGTEGMQQSGFSAHGSTQHDVVFAIDGLNVNLPRGGGGFTGMYYDQGMFEEITYQVSALPAEAAVGGLFINMVTKEGGNRVRGDVKYFHANNGLQGENHRTPELQRFGFDGGNPVTKLYDFNASSGGPFRRDRLWWFVSYRDWKVDSLTLGAKNPDGSPALDDNLIRNYSAKLTWQITRSHKFSYLFNVDDKFRFHRRTQPGPAFVENRATEFQDTTHVQTGPRFTAILRPGMVFESGLSYRDGKGLFKYQKEVEPTDIRVEDPIRNTASVAAPSHQTRPNRRVQSDNTFSFAVPAFLGSHLVKVGAQQAWQFLAERHLINGDMYLIFQDGVPNSVRIFNTPSAATSYARQLGFFAQDSWALGSKVTLNVGGRLDFNRGWWPEHDVPAGRFVEARHLDRRDVISQRIAVWRTGVAYDPRGDGRTAVKASYSRYGAQVGLDRVTNIHPIVLDGPTTGVPWRDLNGDQFPQSNELDFSRFQGFRGVNQRYADARGPDWPYSDEITAGVEREVMRDLRLGVVYYYRTNRKQVGRRNVAVPPTAYTEHSVTIPGPPAGPGGTATFHNLQGAFFGRQDNVLDNEDLLDTTYHGVELTAAKRLSGRWQIMAGLTLGRNDGGLDTGDLNDPNNLINQQGIIRIDSRYSLKVAGSYLAPWGLALSGSWLHNDGYPHQSTYDVTRSAFPGLTRARQTLRLTRRGKERFPDVSMIDIRVSRPIRLGNGRQVSPLIEIFNLTNASTIVALTPAVGSRYLAPTEILAPRIVRLGLRLEF